MKRALENTELPVLSEFKKELNKYREMWGKSSNPISLMQESYKTYTKFRNHFIRDKMQFPLVVLYQDSISLFKKWREDAESDLGPSPLFKELSKSLGLIYLDFADHLLCNEQYVLAEADARNAIQMNIHSVAYLEAAKSYKILFDCLKAQGKFEECVPQLRNVFEKAAEALDRDSDNQEARQLFLESYDSVSKQLYHKNDEEALFLIDQKARKACMKVVLSNPQDLTFKAKFATTIHNIATHLLHSKNYAEAAEEFVKAMELYETMLEKTEQNPQIIQAMLDACSDLSVCVENLQVRNYTYLTKIANAYTAVAKQYDFAVMDGQAEKYDSAIECYDKAITLCETILKSDPDDLEIVDNKRVIYEAMASLSYHNAQFEDAIEPLKKLIALYDEDLEHEDATSSILKKLAKLHYRLGVSIAEDAVNLDLDDKVEALNKAREKCAESIQLYLSILEQSPTDSRLQSKLAKAYFRLGEYSEGLIDCNAAAQNYQKAMKIYKTLIEQRQGEAMLKQYNEVVTRYEAVLRKDVSDLVSKKIMLNVHDLSYGDCEERGDYEGMSQSLQHSIVLRREICDTEYNEDTRGAMHSDFACLLYLLKHHGNSMPCTTPIALLAAQSSINISGYDNYAKIVFDILSKSSNIRIISYNDHISEELKDQIAKNRSSWKSLMLMYARTDAGVISYINKLDLSEKLFEKSNELNEDQRVLLEKCEAVSKTDRTKRLTVKDFAIVITVAEEFKFIFTRYLPSELIAKAHYMMCSMLAPHIAKKGDFGVLNLDVCSNIIEQLPMHERPKLALVCKR